jgi:hypothetical protein
MISLGEKGGEGGGGLENEKSLIYIGYLINVTFEKIPMFPQELQEDEER